MRFPILILSLFVLQNLLGQKAIVKNNKIERVLTFDGKVWRTTKFSSIDHKISIAVKSDEVNILGMDSSEGLSIGDFNTIGAPRAYTSGDTNFLSIAYKQLAYTKKNEVAPQRMIIKYFAIKNENFIRKNITLIYDKPTTIDRLEVERFVIPKDACGGGRGQPVFVNNQWFFALEYPAGYSRHTDGNTPKSYSRHFEKVGNYSFINLEGRDIEPHATKGMLRLMHFPGYTVKINHSYQINSKTAVEGFAENNESITRAFMQYLSTIWKRPRSFLHYNNWFDSSAKDLSGNGLLDVYLAYKKNISPYGVKLDAVVADDGWQNRNSIWQPSPEYFPKGDTSLAALSRKLKEAGVGFGLWLSLNGYNNNIEWGVKKGFKEAKPNSYFKQFNPYYSISATKYKNYLLKRLPQLAKEADLVYFKHDFNEMSDLASGNNHPPDDRHGHEASVDAAIEMLQATTKAQPNIIQNLTNWVWFSPWWLTHVDYLWMLAGDDGMNGNWPELSTQARSTTDRDTYIWRMWGDPADRPLVPISRLMTHGIIRKATPKDETLQDWLEYVLMYYGRGTLLKEWYITPSSMSADEWKGLCLVNNWAKKHQQELTNTVYVGGRPDEGNAYGYIGWKNEKGVLVARNPQALAQTLIIPFNKATGFYGKLGDSFKANVVFPYQAIYPKTFISGKNISITLPGYSTMAFELSSGKSNSTPDKFSSIQFKKTETPATTTLTVPSDARGRCDLLLIGRPNLPSIHINGKSVIAARKSASSINNFASYAKTGMISKKATEWHMESFDLLPFAGKTITITYSTAAGFKSYILVERKIKNPLKPKKDNENLWPITNDTRREVLEIF